MYACMIPRDKQGHKSDGMLDIKRVVAAHPKQANLGSEEFFAADAVRASRQICLRKRRKRNTQANGIFDAFINRSYSSDKKGLVCIRGINLNLVQKKQ